jgi:anti-anti-sigma factor
MSRLADLETEDRDGVTLSRLGGELDLSNVADVTDAIAQATPSSALGLVLDMAELRHIDSAGVRMLFDLRRRLGQRRQELALAVPEHARIRDVLDLLAVGETIPLLEDVDAALAVVRDAAGG